MKKNKPFEKCMEIVSALSPEAIEKSKQLIQQYPRLPSGKKPSVLSELDDNSHPKIYINFIPKMDAETLKSLIIKMLFNNRASLASNKILIISEQIQRDAFYQQFPLNSILVSGHHAHTFAEFVLEWSSKIMSNQNDPKIVELTKNITLLKEQIHEKQSILEEIKKVKSQRQNILDTLKKKKMQLLSLEEETKELQEKTQKIFPISTPIKKRISQSYKGDESSSGSDTSTPETTSTTSSSVVMGMMPQ